MIRLLFVPLLLFLPLLANDENDGTLEQTNEKLHMQASAGMEQSEAGYCPDCEIENIKTGLDAVEEKIDLISEIYEYNRYYTGNKFQEYLETTFGFLVHKSCIDHFGSNNIAQSMIEGLGIGLDCMREFGSKKQILTHAIGIIDVTNSNTVSSKKIKVRCDASKKQVGEYAMLASPEDMNVDLKAGCDPTGNNCNVVKVPYLAIDTDDFDQENAEEFRRSFFHEMFHLLGYRHSEDEVDYAYMCQAACFHRDIEVSAYNMAVKLCNSPKTAVLEDGYKDNLYFVLNQIGYQNPEKDIYHRYPTAPE